MGAANNVVGVAINVVIENASIHVESLVNHRVRAKLFLVGSAFCVHAGRIAGAVGSIASVSLPRITDRRIRILSDQRKPAKRWFNTIARQPSNVSSGVGQTVHWAVVPGPNLCSAGVGQWAPGREG